ncbi:hypothetical protein Tco_1538561 [Tanacetum coccineum]
MQSESKVDMWTWKEQDYIKMEMQIPRSSRSFHANANSELKCVKCNGCMLFDNHDLCVLDFINNVNACNKSKSVKQSSKRKVWKPTGKSASKHIRHFKLCGVPEIYYARVFGSTAFVITVGFDLRCISRNLLLFAAVIKQVSRGKSSDDSLVYITINHLGHVLNKNVNYAFLLLGTDEGAGDNRVFSRGTRHHSNSEEESWTFSDGDDDDDDANKDSDEHDDDDDATESDDEGDNITHPKLSMQVTNLSVMIDIDKCGSATDNSKNVIQEDKRRAWGIDKLPH